ncbi:MAG: hypothetical protein ACK46Q_03505 [Hyphomonas sp.]
MTIFSSFNALKINKFFIDLRAVYPLQSDFLKILEIHRFSGARRRKELLFIGRGERRDF